MASSESTDTVDAPPGIEKILRRFATLNPDMTRLALVQYANRLPPVPERFQALDRGPFEVHECQTPVALYPELADGRMYFYCDVPQGAPTVRALLAMITEAVNGEPPAAVLAIPPDFVRQVMDKIGIGLREVGLNAIVARLKRAAREAENGV